MTMRKYLVTIHEDGSVSALEYDEPKDREIPTHKEWEKVLTDLRQCVYAETIRFFHMDTEISRAYCDGANSLFNRLKYLF